MCYVESRDVIYEVVSIVQLLAYLRISSASPSPLASILDLVLSYVLLIPDRAEDILNK